MAEYVLIATCVAALVHRARLITYGISFKNFTNDQALHFCHQFLKDKQGSQQLIKDLWNRNRSRNFFQRRGNFQGITLFGITELWTTYNYLTNLFKQEEHVSQTVPNTHEVRCIFRLLVF